MSRAKIIAKSEECVWIARSRTVSLFGYQAINCSRARRSTPFRSRNSCSHGAPSPCFGRLDRARRLQASDLVNENGPEKFEAVPFNFVESLDLLWSGRWSLAFSFALVFFLTLRSSCGRHLSAT